MPAFRTFRSSTAAVGWDGEKLVSSKNGAHDEQSIVRLSNTVTRIWAKHGIKPHRCEGSLASNDPEFETKAADVIGAVSESAATRGGVLCG